MAAHEELRQPGDHPVDAPITCVLTRFGLRHAHHLPPTYKAYRRLTTEVRRQSPPGLLRSAFLLENPSTCWSVSIWSGPPEFSAAVPQHVDAARDVFGRLSIDEERGPELWSTKWRLASVSNNLNWADFELRELLAAERRS